MLILVAACSAPADTAVRIDAVTPAYGPLAGGTRIVIAGDRFADDAGPTRVLVGGRESPLANAIDDATLEVVIPPGDQPGDAELVVFNRNGTAISTTAFHYAAQPAITAIAPATVIYNVPTTTMTVTGSGFLDDGAGEPIVLVDGVPALDVEVTSDTELTFTAPSGRALGRPRVEVANARGVAAKDRGFRYRPSARSGLLLFALTSQTFATFFDPVDKSLVSIPRVGPFIGLSSVVVDDEGEYWGTERSGGRLGRIDLGTQRFEQPVQIGFRLPAMTRIDGMQYGFDRWTLRFGKFGLDGAFQHVGETLMPCCGSYGMAYNGTALYFTSRTGQDKFINTIDRDTGELGTPVKLLGTPSLHIEEMRFFGGKLFAASRDGNLVEIDPATGAVTHVASIFRSNAMEVFE
ncbi:MAG: IPT/TIG domain-containing protein [Myxococcota bacterium]|nr:IPT/TIG domain-containing protein [Deltaproteobacteria bacterium]MDQ3334416.1 IPT/TIG domain-containing protein [Myxococcota bacterium]